MVTRKVVVVGTPVDPTKLEVELQNYGYKIVKLDHSTHTKEYIHANGLPHLMVVDVDKPEVDGLSLCRELYDRAGLPIITVSHSPTRSLATHALTYADDYVCGDISAEELAMRIRRILSRINDFSYASGPKLKIYEWLTVDPVQREVQVKNDIYKLTPIENSLLHVLIKHKGDVVDADTLIERVWHSDPSVSDRNVLRVHIHRLRQKLEADPNLPRVILTERGIGYSFADLERT